MQFYYVGVEYKAMWMGSTLKNSGGKFRRGKG